MAMLLALGVLLASFAHGLLQSDECSAAGDAHVLSEKTQPRDGIDLEKEKKVPNDSNDLMDLKAESLAQAAAVPRRGADWRGGNLRSDRESGLSGRLGVSRCQ